MFVHYCNHVAHKVEKKKQHSELCYSPSIVLTLVKEPHDDIPPTLLGGVQPEGVATDTLDMVSQREGEPGLLLKEPIVLKEDWLGRGERGERGVEDSSSSCSY